MIAILLCRLGYPVNVYISIYTPYNILNYIGFCKSKIDFLSIP